MGVGLGNRWAAWRSKHVRASGSFTSQPEPRSIGIPARGAQMKVGQFLFSGHLVEAPNTSIWDIPKSSTEFEIDIHGFHWLDHLAAEGSADARRLARDWVFQWGQRFGGGGGPGWQPSLAGRRLLRLINHSTMLLMGEEKSRQDAFFKLVSQQGFFLSKRAQKERPGLPRIEALAGLIHAALSFDRQRKYLDAAMAALAKECSSVVDETGEIPSRNAEDLMNIFTALAWVTHVVSESDLVPEREHMLAMERIVPVLRSLRLGDGGLGHFHGSGRGMEGRLDQALIDSAVRIPAAEEGGMGIHRIAQSGAVLLVDKGPQSSKYAKHFSPMAFEFSFGRVPLIVNPGPGNIFGDDWRRTSASILAHSTSSVNDETPKLRSDKGVLLKPDVTSNRNASFAMIAAGYDAYSASHGLRSYRSLELSSDGHILRGRDVQAAETPEQQKQFKRWQKKNRKRGIPWSIRFHLHPDIAAEVGMKGKAVTLTTKSGDVWVLTLDEASLKLEKSEYMQYGRLHPRATKQVVATARATSYESVVNWTLRKS
ncbi:MAG: heparinase II/III family protein [Pseudomonadota bacterium]